MIGRTDPAVASHDQALQALWLNEQQAATRIGCSVSRLRSDRHKCRGIPYVKFGRSVRYSLADIQAHMDSNLITPVQ